MSLFSDLKKRKATAEKKRKSTGKKEAAKEKKQDGKRMRLAALKIDGHVFLVDIDKNIDHLKFIYEQLDLCRDTMGNLIDHREDMNQLAEDVNDYEGVWE